MNQFIRINGSLLNHSSLRFKEINTLNQWERDIYHFAAWLTDNDNTPITFKTSGSTGLPKIITFSKQEIIDASIRTIRFFQLNNQHRFLLCLPATFVAGRMMIARAWACGADLFTVTPSLNPLACIDCSITFDFAAFTPPQIETILNDSSKSKLEKINTIIIGGSPVNNKLQKKLLGMPNNIYLTYGMTETLSHVAVKKISFPATEYYQSISPDIYFSTGPDDSLVIHVNNKIIKTTDQVQLIDSKKFFWLGRTDNVINSGGLKIHPEQLEAVILNTGLIPENRFYITAIADERWGERPCLITLDEISEEQLQAINKQLQKHHQIKKAIRVKEFEYTPTGKLIRKKLIG